MRPDAYEITALPIPIRGGSGGSVMHALELSHRISCADEAIVYRMYDAIEYRGARQADVETLAEHAGVPVYNELTAE